MGQAVRIIEEFSTLTAKGQTTVPKPVRQALGLSEGDQIAFRVDDKGVTVRRADETRADPAIGAFLDLIARDIQSNPKALSALSPTMAKHIASLVDGVEFDPDTEIEGDTDL